jgi:hypothetical protein
LLLAANESLVQDAERPAALLVLLEIVEGREQQPARRRLVWGFFAIGAHERGKREIDTGIPLKSFLYPGMKELFLARSPEYEKLFSENLKVSQDDYNPMRHVIRSVLFVRGKRPYVLVVDDCDKDGQPHDWRWSMNCAQGFAPGLDTRFVDGSGKGVYSSLSIAPGATPQEAVLLHSPIDDERRPGQTGLPRLLVRDLGPAATAEQPAIVLESRPPGGSGPYLTYGYDNNRAEKVATPVPTNRVLIERRNVVRPDYVVLPIELPISIGDILMVPSEFADHPRTRALAEHLLDHLRSVSAGMVDIQIHQQV